MSKLRTLAETLKKRNDFADADLLERASRILSVMLAKALENNNKNILDLIKSCSDPNLKDKLNTLAKYLDSKCDRRESQYLQHACDVLATMKGA